MIILSNCLTETADEGSLNVANSLIKRIKKRSPETMLVSYERPSPLSDRHMRLNKLLLNGEWIRLLREKREPVLYIPFPARMLPTALRIFLLSRFARWGLRAVLVMNSPMNGAARWLMKASGAEVVAISRPTWEMYRDLIGSRAVHLKAGVDTQRFRPVDAQRKRQLREAYGLPLDRPIVLHVGHMKTERNVGLLSQLDESWHGLLVVSTLTRNEQNDALRQQLEARPNLTVLDTYQPRIEELYQLADVYLFPVMEAGHCIDVPLSALEAAACGIPVVATPYGELRDLVDQPGFYRMDTTEPEEWNALLPKAAAEQKNPRQSVLDYDWNYAVEQLLL